MLKVYFKKRPQRALSACAIEETPCLQSFFIGKLTYLNHTGPFIRSLGVMSEEICFNLTAYSLRYRGWNCLSQSTLFASVWQIEKWRGLSKRPLVNRSIGIQANVGKFRSSYISIMCLQGMYTTGGEVRAKRNDV